MIDWTTAFADGLAILNTSFDISVCSFDGSRNGHAVSYV